MEKKVHSLKYKFRDVTSTTRSSHVRVELKWLRFGLACLAQPILRYKGREWLVVLGVYSRASYR
jgi:hypothetical protein